MFSATRLFAALIAASALFAAGCSSTSSQSSTGEYLDDSAITTKVKSAIFNEASLKVLQINVETYKSVVQLSGFADSSTDISTASKVAQSVAGVKSVKNDMRLK